MEQKRALTSVDLAALEAELRGYRGVRVDKAYLYPDDRVRLKCRDFDRGRVELLAAVGDPKRVNVAAPERVPDAPDRPPDFARMLRNRIAGGELVGVDQFEFDRILSLAFERDGARTTVVVELFGDGNVAVLNENREVISALDTVRLKSRTVAPGATYEYPASRFDPLTADYEAFAAAMDDSDTDVVRTLATRLNFGGLWAEELCTRAGVEKTLSIAEAGADAYEPLFGAIERLRDRLRDGRFEPRVYYDSPAGDEGGTEGDGDRGRPVNVAPVPLAEFETADCVAHDSFNAAVDAYFHALEREREGDDGGGDGAPGRPDFEAEIAKHERIIAQQEEAIESFDERADEERARAEALYARYDLVDEVLSAVADALAEGHSWEEIEDRFRAAGEAGNERASHVVGVRPDEGRVTVELDGRRIDLDPDAGVERNADRLYGEAKRIEEKKEGALAAIENTREDLAAAKRRREEWSAGDEAQDEPDAGEDREVDWLARDSIPVRYDERWYERFRWFHTSDGFLVIGGRDADDNEELVEKYMEPTDLFVHAQAHGGPVTVIKATGPSEAARDVEIPERSREEAARFAVSYSSVWKDGRFAGDAYLVAPEQVSKTPEPGEYLSKGGFAVRGERTYYEDTPVDAAVGITCEPETRVVGGPTAPVADRAETHVRLEPGRYAQNDVAKLLYREFKSRFADEAFVRKVASPDRIQEFCPPGGSRTLDADE